MNPTARPMIMFISEKNIEVPPKHILDIRFDRNPSRQYRHNFYFSLDSSPFLTFFIAIFHNIISFKGGFFNKICYFL